MIFRIGNGAKVAVEAVGTYPLRLLSGFRLDLKDCYFIPVASRNLIFIFMLAQDGFDFNFNKNFYFIYLQNKLIASNFLIDSLYYLHINANVNLNKQVVSTVDQKKFKNKINQKY